MPRLKAANRFRVLHVGKFYSPHKGGMETHLEQLCSSLQDNFQVTVVVASDSRSRTVDQLQNVQVVRTGTLCTISSAPICPGLISELRNTPADIIHLHHPNPVAFLAYVMSGHRGKLVVTYHSDIVRQKWLRFVVTPLVKYVLRRSAAIVVTSPDFVNSSRVLPSMQSQCTIIPLGVDVSQFTSTNNEAVEQLRARYGPRIVLSVGRLVYYKGFEYLIRAMKDVPGTLLLVGTGPLEDRLQHEVRQSSVQDRVHMLGEVPDLVPYYHASDVFVLPSVHQSEAFGFVQLEAMACGKPVINTNLPSGVPFVSKDGLTGISVQPGDSGALAAAMNQLLDDPALRAQYGAAAKVRATREFSLDLMVDRTVQLYQNVLGDLCQPDSSSVRLTDQTSSATVGNVLQ